MAAALIKFTQGATTDVAGRAVKGATGASVVASNGDNTGVTLWAWYLLDAPETSALLPSATPWDPDATAMPVGSPISTSSTYAFTPDVTGTYEVALFINGVPALFDVRDFIIEEAAGGWIPALRTDHTTANFSGQKRGFKPGLEPLLRKAAAGAAAPTVVVNSTSGTHATLANLRAQVVVHKATGATTYPLPTGPSDLDYVDVERDSTGTGTIAIDGGSVNISDGSTLASSFGPSASLISVRATYYAADNVWRLS